MVRSAIAALVVALFGTAGASAQLLGYEGFDYPANSALGGLNGGTGWSSQASGTWSTSAPTFVIGSGSLSPPAPADALATGGNQLSLPTNGPFTSATRTFGSDLRTVTGTPSVWVSFVIARTTGDNVGTFGGLVIGNDPGSDNTTGRLFIGDSGAGPPAPDTWSLERAGGGALGVSNYIISSVPKALLVAHIQFNDSGPEQINLYVNRPLGGGTPISADASLNTLDINPSGGPVTDFGVWYGAGTYQIDEIRIGASFADVTPVPEPGLALGLGVMAMFGASVVSLIGGRGPGRAFGAEARAEPLPSYPGLDSALTVKIRLRDTETEPTDKSLLSGHYQS